MTRKSGPNPSNSLADRIEAMDHALKVMELAHLLSWCATSLYDYARSGRMGRAVIRSRGKLRFDPYWTGQWLRGEEGEL